MTMRKTKEEEEEVRKARALWHNQDACANKNYSSHVVFMCLVYQNGSGFLLPSTIKKIT